MLGIYDVTSSIVGVFVQDTPDIASAQAAITDKGNVGSIYEIRRETPESERGIVVQSFKLAGEPEKN